MGRTQTPLEGGRQGGARAAHALTKLEGHYLQLSSASNKRSYEAHLTSDDTEHLGNWEAAPAGTHHTPGKEHDLYDGRVKAAACDVWSRTAFTWQNQHEAFRQAEEVGWGRSLLF